MDLQTAVQKIDRKTEAHNMDRKTEVQKRRRKTEVQKRKRKTEVQRRTPKIEVRRYSVTPGMKVLDFGAVGASPSAEVLKIVCRVSLKQQVLARILI